MNNQINELKEILENIGDNSNKANAKKFEI